jgi:predicted dehydrogenase
MVGGGQGAFIGAVHRIASRIDDRYELVAGAFSSNPEKSIASGSELGIDQDRNYKNYQEMVEKESIRKDKIDVVAIVTPNHMHHPIAMAFIEKGFHIICDKPLGLL